MSKDPLSGRIELTGRRTRTDYHKGMDAGSLSLSIFNHSKYTLAKDL